MKWSYLVSTLGSGGFYRKRFDESQKTDEKSFKQKRKIQSILLPKPKDIKEIMNNEKKDEMRSEKKYLLDKK